MCIVNYWPASFRQLYGGDWPDTYCALDLETTGFNMTQDVITEWGHCFVQDGKVVDRLSLVLDWTNHEIVPDQWLRTRMRALKQGMELGGSVCHHNIERMKKEGMKPDKAFKFIAKFVSTLQSKGVIFVAHGGTFDEKMLCANFSGFGIASGFTFGDNGLLDTEGIEKASQVVDNARLHPKSDDTLRTYFHRVRYTRLNAVKSNLDVHCYHKYKFLEKHNIQRRELHGASTDALCVHLLMEEYRSQLLPQIVQPPIFPFEEHKQARKAKPVSASAPQAQLQGPRVRIRGQRNN